VTGAFRDANAGFSIQNTVTGLGEREDARFGKRDAKRCRGTARPSELKFSDPGAQRSHARE
jgi:hypothetical protein